MTANQAFRIDIKLDDGLPETGFIFDGNSGCVIAGGGAYDEANNGAQCDLFIRFLN